MRWGRPPGCLLVEAGRERSRVCPVDAARFRGPSLALRIAALLVGGETVLAAGVSLLLLLVPYVGGGFTKSTEVTLIYGVLTVLIAGSGGATAVGLWRGRFWATVAAFIGEVAWAVVLLGGVLGPLGAAPAIIFVSPAVLVGLLLVVGVRRRPHTPL
jgi:hypothetical protein